MHRARTKDGQDVALKIKYADVERQLAVDLGLMRRVVPAFNIFVPKIGLEVIAEELADLSMERLRRSIDVGGDQLPIDEKRLSRARRAVLKAADILSEPDRRAGFDERRMFWFRVGALLHDVGKIGVPDAILFKPSGLTPEEYEILKRHTVIGEAPSVRAASISPEACIRKRARVER